MSKFEKLVLAIKHYDSQNKIAKTTAHHSAVSVRIEEMKAATAKLENETNGMR